MTENEKALKELTVNQMRSIEEYQRQEVEYEKRIAELEANNELYEGGYKGGCYACEKVGELNLTLRDAADNYRCQILNHVDRIAELESEACRLGEALDMHTDEIVPKLKKRIAELEGALKQYAEQTVNHPNVARIALEPKGRDHE